MLVLIGLISGILSGITGLQYGILIPALLLTGIIPDIKTAVGTLLYAFIPPVTALSAYSFYNQVHLNIRKGNVVMITVSLAMLLGSKIATYLSEKTIHLITAFLTLSISLFFFSLSIKN